MKTSSVSDPENPSFRAQVSLAFRNEASARFYEGNAPSVASRMEGITALREAGIPVTLRIDPLFVRSPLPVFPEMNLSDFGLIEAQSIDDLQNLVEFGKKVGVESIVYSPLKIVQPRGKQLNSVMQAMLQVYRQICYPGKPDWNGGSWRLPRKIAHELLVDPFLEICRQAGVKTRFCMQDLIQNR
jgi:hypothetical protein